MWKKLLIGSIAILVVASAIGLVLPRNIHVERSTVIHAAPSAVFAYINDFHKFNLWSPWAKHDPNTQYTFSGQDQGTGATMAWRSEHPNVGNGQQKIIVSDAGRHVQTELNFGDMGTAFATFDLVADGTDTRVTWGFDQDTHYNIVSRYFGLLMDKFIGPDYEQGLVNLKTLAESTQPAVVTPAATTGIAPAPITAPAIATAVVAASPASSNGLDLARKSGCLACHSIDRKVVGPAWKDVAARYKNNAGAKSQLINKVKTGGKGNWTDVTGGAPMPPYSPRVSDADITALVEFVLAL